SSRRRHTRSKRDWSSDVCSSDLIDVDIINEVAKREGWDVDMTFPGFDAAVNAVQSGQADALMAGTTITDARKKVFTFSDPYYDTAVVVYTRGNAKIPSYKQLHGKTIGAT